LTQDLDEVAGSAPCHLFAEQQLFHYRMDFTRLICNDCLLQVHGMSIRQTDAQADRRSGRPCSPGMCISKKKIMVSQTEGSKQEAAKGEEEQYAQHCMVHRQGQQAEDEQQHGR